MALTLEQRVKMLETKMARALATTAALQGQPADATLSIPHNDSWLFVDNVDSTHAGNLRYVISSNVQRIVSARLSLHLAPYRTYNSLSLTATGNESATHVHASAAHSHEMWTFGTGSPGATAITLTAVDGTGNAFGVTAASGGFGSTNTQSTTPGNTGTESAGHTHTVSGTSTLGVTEGATASGVTISFDGVDHTAALGGPFSTDQIELNVLPYLPQSKSAFHTIAMLPSGLGRLEAHLRLGVYVAAGSAF